MNKQIPILITLDIHSYPQTEKELPAWIDYTLEVFNSLLIKATFLFPAIFAEQFSRSVLKILKEGHEIGCHGLTHGIDEQYNILPCEKQKSILKEAKERIESVTSTEVVSFRAPVFKISGNTVRALEENGFKADLSVNSQRLGIFSSEITNIGWLYSPRQPYNPDFNNPFKRGDSSIWEIPQSAFILPFISNINIAFGGSFMKLFFKILHLESAIRGNPIVYMVHPEDIFPRDEVFKYKFQWKHLFPSKSTGFIFRHALFNNKNNKKIAREIIDLLQIMQEIKNIKFFTVKEMVTKLTRKIINAGNNVAGINDTHNR